MGAADETRPRQFSLELREGERLFVLSLPREGAERLLDALSPAERQVVELVLSGCSNAEISRQRGVSVHTVCNQLKAVFRKLGCSGRVELLAMLSRTDPSRPPKQEASSS